MKPNTILIIVTILVIGAGVYWYFFTGTGNQAPLVGSTSGSSVLETRFQTLVSQLQSISLDTTILSDPKFVSLVDISTKITPEPSGRTDPFAPIAGVTSTGI